MTDPLADIVTLLKPSARFSKLVEAAGVWRVARSDVGQPFYAVVLEGECTITLDDGAPMPLQARDFVLVPAARDFAMASPLPAQAVAQPVMLGDGKVRVGDPDGSPDLRMLVGHCRFESPDAALLVSLLPEWVHVRDESRLATLVQLVGDEARAQRPARDVVLSRLLEVLFIEALRTTAGTAAWPGLVCGLADTRIGRALKAMHDQPGRAWTMAALASEAALSRSSFFERFRRRVGVAPMAYLLTWRMALAKKMLREDQEPVVEVAARVGYRSASTFSVAFRRHVGQTPARFARAQCEGIADTRIRSALDDV